MRILSFNCLEHGLTRSIGLVCETKWNLVDLQHFWKARTFLSKPKRAAGELTVSEMSGIQQVMITPQVIILPPYTSHNKSQQHQQIQTKTISPQPQQNSQNAHNKSQNKQASQHHTPQHTTSHKFTKQFTKLARLYQAPAFHEAFNGTLP